MKTIDWLPPEPLPVSKCLEYKRTFDHIAECTPMLGVRPDPEETVALLYVGIHHLALWAAFDPDERAWVAIESGAAADLGPDVTRILTDAIAFVESRHPDDTFTLLKRADPALN